MKLPIPAPAKIHAALAKKPSAAVKSVGQIGLLVLALAVLLGSVQPTETLAAPAQTAKPLHGKSQLPVKKHPGDVWERIRSTMQIPRPGPMQALPDQPPTNLSATLPDTRINPASPLQTGAQKIRLPATVSAPLYNYTPYGRLKLNAAVASRIRKPVVLPGSSIAPQSADVQEMAAVYKRLHTRIESPVRLQTTLEAAPLADSVESLIKPRPTTEGGPIIPRRTSATTQYERVNKHIVWYTQHKAYLHQVAERAHPYLYHIVEKLSQHQLPSELALLPIVESAYQPTALSPKSAAGLWQFMPSTGHDFDLHQTAHYDARLDIAASTHAAMRYLAFLKQHFNGDWLLALAAYNCGLGVVDDAIERNTAEGLASDYWSLRLPEETQEYVPRFLALSSIFANPEAHGLKLAPVRNEPYFVKVHIDRKHDIAYLAEKEFKEIAQLADLSYEQFTRLNPGYLNPKLTADGPYTFFMPTANANQLHQRLASIAKFLDKSTAITATNPAPLADEQKTALSLLTPKGADFDPYLSLDLDTRPTSPRIAPLSAAPKRVKKRISL